MGRYKLITTEEEFNTLLDAVGDGPCALDFETTGLEPPAQVRLAQLCNDDVWAVIDFWQLPGKTFSAYAHWFENSTWIAFNAAFEYSWFANEDLVDVCVKDVAHLRRAVMGGDQMSFAQLLAADLNYVMPKEEQKSNWGAEQLTESQLTYAADDALWTWRAYRHWRDRVREVGAEYAADMFDALVPIVYEMRETGLLLDAGRHRKLTDHWAELSEKFREQLRVHVTEEEVLNLSSRKQWSDFFSKILPDDILQAWPRTDKTGQLQMTTASCKEMAVMLGGERGDNPLVDVLYSYADMVTVDQYLSNFGDKLLNMAERSADGKIHPSYNIARAVTGRFSSSSPNAQQLPRDRELLGEETSVRASFIAPRGKVLVTLDYSGIELRTLALLADDEQLLHDCIDGDLHAEVGAYMVGRPLDKSKPEDKRIRSSAKGVSFGIIYGSSAGGLAGSLRTSLHRAQQLVDFWADRYPRAFNLRHEVMKEAVANDGYARMVDDGTIYLGKKPALPKCANYPVQRAALSLMARALIRHRESLTKMVHGRGGDWEGVRMAATIHDAAIDEAPVALAQDVLQLMADDMTKGYLDIFPGAPTKNLLEGGFGPCWGTIKDMEVTGNDEY